MHPRPLRSSGKRVRNVAVLFADIEGCTRLCEDLRPREMNRLIERYFSRFLDVVQDAGGDITEILGDGVVNIGINVGPALVGVTRLRGKTGERRVYSGTGPVTNVAARLCALATGGQILVERKLARMLRGACRARRLGRRKLKNVSALVEVFEIVRV